MMSCECWVFLCVWCMCLLSCILHVRLVIPRKMYCMWHAFWCGQSCRDAFTFDLSQCVCVCVSKQHTLFQKDFENYILVSEFSLCVRVTNVTPHPRTIYTHTRSVSMLFIFNHITYANGCQLVDCHRRQRLRVSVLLPAVTGADWQPNSGQYYNSILKTSLSVFVRFCDVVCEERLVANFENWHCWRFAPAAAAVPHCSGHQFAISHAFGYIKFKKLYYDREIDELTVGFRLCLKFNGQPQFKLYSRIIATMCYSWIDLARVSTTSHGCTLKAIRFTHTHPCRRFTMDHMDWQIESFSCTTFISHCSMDPPKQHQQPNFRSSGRTHTQNKNENKTFNWYT